MRTKKNFTTPEGRYQVRKALHQVKKALTVYEKKERKEYEASLAVAEMRLNELLRKMPEQASRREDLRKLRDFVREIRLTKENVKEALTLIKELESHFEGPGISFRGE